MSYPPPPPPGQPYQGQPYQGQPQPYGQPVPPYAPPPKSGGSGCLVAALITLAVLLVLCAVGGFVAWRVFDAVKDSVPGLGDAECPTEGDVSDVVGRDVELTLDADIVVAAGCNYSGSGVGVTITEGAGLIADEEIQSVRDTAAGYGVEPEPIDVGEDGIAFGTPQRSEAIAKHDGSVIGVEIFSEGTRNIGNQQDAAVELLEDYIDLN